MQNQPRSNRYPLWLNTAINRYPADSNAASLPKFSSTETGYLVQPNNPNELCQALQKLIEDRKLRIRMGSAGRERAVNNFDNNNRVESLLLFYELIRSKPN